MPGKTRKATFNINEDVLAAMDSAMAKGAAPTKNALVERALVKELKEIERQARKARWEQGAKDPLLMKDIKDIEESFMGADAETARRIV